MDLVKTRNFDLAVYKKGDESSPKLALVMPGKLDTKDYSSMQKHVDYLAKKSYLAISFDPPGTWESPGGIELYTMTNWLQAIDELIEYFGGKPTFTIGHSRGGSMSMLAGLRNPKVTHFASIMSYYSFAQGTYPGYPNKDTESRGYKAEERDLPPGDVETGGRQFELPYFFDEDASQYDMLEELGKSDKPKLFFFGTEDETVRPEVVKSAYKASKEPKQIHELSSDHNYRYHDHLIDEVNRVTGEFLELNKF